MNCKGAILRIANNIISTVFYASRHKPTFYCGRWMLIPSTMWESLFSRYELAVAHVIRDHLERGQTFWDIGANVGWFSVFASKIVGPSGRVVSFEPSPEVFDILFAHAKTAEELQQFAWASVTPMRFGYLRHRKIVLFVLCGRSDENEFPFSRICFDPTYQVELRKVDSLVKELGRSLHFSKSTSKASIRSSAGCLGSAFK